ncbi:MAG: hypothetical protein ACOC0H_02355 [Thermodesulfobacteriota bacterium]
MAEKKDETTRTGHSVETLSTPEETPTYKEMSPIERAELEALRAEIAAERMETRATIEALQAQLTPAHLKSQARKKVRKVTVGKAEHMAHSAGYKAKNMGSSAWDTLKDNWVPTALIGVGAAWLAKSHQGGGSRSEDVYYDPYFDDEFPDDQLRDYAGPSADMHHYYAGPAEEGGGGGSRTGQAREKASRAASHARDKAGDMMAQTREKLSSAGEQAGGMVHNARERASESAGRMGHEARRLSRRAGDKTRRMKDDNPLMMAGALFGIGAALGFLIPETRKESEWMGETRDELVEKAKTRGKETLEQAKEAAKESGRTAAETAKEEARNKGLTSGSSAFGETHSGADELKSEVSTSAKVHPSTGTKPPVSSKPAPTGATIKKDEKLP